MKCHECMCAVISMPPCSSCVLCEHWDIPWGGVGECTSDCMDCGCVDRDVDLGLESVPEPLPLVKDSASL